MTNVDVMFDNVVPILVNMLVRSSMFLGIVIFGLEPRRSTVLLPRL